MKCRIEYEFKGKWYPLFGDSSVFFASLEDAKANTDKDIEELGLICNFRYIYENGEEA